MYDQGLEEELQSRHGRIRSALENAGAAALLATRPSTVTYLTGYTTSTWSNFSRPIVALLTNEGLYMVVAETEADAVRERVPGVTVVDYVELLTVSPELHLPDGAVQFSPAAATSLASVIPPKVTIGVDGYHSVFPPVAQLTDLIPNLNERCIDASGMMWNLMMEKSQWELGKLRHAAAILDSALLHLQSELRPGMTERRVFQTLAAAAFDAGAHGLGYNDVVAGVKRGLFGAPTDKVWEPGEVLYVDGGVLVDGYWADFCRMYTVGSPTAEQAAGFGRALRGLREGLAAVQQTTTAAELCAIIQDATDLRPDDVGFGRFGHGLGLYMPEPPSIHISDHTPLRGKVLCVEPAVLHEGGNYVVEEEYFFAGDHLERLSPAVPDHLIEIG